jgi:hypothetical protein
MNEKPEDLKLRTKAEFTFKIGDCLKEIGEIECWLELLVESSLFLSDRLTGHEAALAPARELSQLAALRQATRLGRFSARANLRAAVWDKPRSDCTVGVSRFTGRSHGL